MRKMLGAALLLTACFAPAHGQATKTAAPAAASEALKQLEHDWVNAMKAGDTAKLNQIIADDWSGLGSDGAKSTKKEFLNNVKTGVSKVESFEFGPMDVMIMGTVAVVQGTDTEKSSFKGKDTSGKWAWMDVFVLRDGKWQAIRSQSAIVK